MKDTREIEFFIIFFGWLSIGVVFMMSNIRAMILSGFLLTVACIGTAYVTYKVWMNDRD